MGERLLACLVQGCPCVVDLRHWPEATEWICTACLDGVTPRVRETHRFFREALVIYPEDMVLDAQAEAAWEAVKADAEIAWARVALPA